MSDEDEDFNDCKTSFRLNLDGQGDTDDEDPSTSAESRSTTSQPFAPTVPPTPAAVMAEAFDRLNTDNDADAWKKEVKLKFDPHDALYWFNAVEADMKRFGINKQWDKKNSIVPLLPSDVVEELKPFLRLTEDEAGTTIYYDVKQELLSLYGPKEEDAYQKAKSLKLTTTPSALGKKLVHAVCPGAKPFDTCHCARMVYGFWLD